MVAMNLINGQEMAQNILKNLKKEVASLPFVPVFSDMIIGDDPASISYVKIKSKRAEEIGLRFELLQLPSSASTEEVTAKLKEIQNDKALSGLIVQLPLPEHLDRSAILNSIDPKVDVDGLSDANMKSFYSGKSKIVPPTAAAVMTIIDSLQIEADKLKFLVVGQGDLVGKPVTFLLKQRNYNVATADQSTIDLKKLTLEADVIISGTGQPNLIAGSMVKPGAILIDCGTAESNGGIVGDIDAKSVADKAAFLSPVPGGVGPVTVAQLLYNVVEVAKNLK